MGRPRRDDGAGPVTRGRSRGGGSRRRARAGARRSDERGGAVSLWVVLMVPVSAFAAVVAMAGPQRLAAESTMQEATDDLAAFAAAWRDGHGMGGGELPAFPPECVRSDDQQAELTDQLLALQVLSDTIAQETDEDVIDYLEDEKDALEAEKNALSDRLQEWERVCTALFEALVRDLGNLGVDIGSLRGFYSNSLTEGEVIPGERAVPCRVSQRVVVSDAVHVALSADWQDAGWAAAQVWPDGQRMAAESMGRVSRVYEADPADPNAFLVSCGERLVVLDERGRPVLGPLADSRVLSSSVRRTPVSG